MLAEEMKRNEISLTQFSSQRRIFRIEDENKKRLIVENIGDFRNFLKNVDVRIRSFEVMMTPSLTF
jgi:alcohol dehydrogenase YqhD (iron-dependent ADH family)